MKKAIILTLIGFVAGALDLIPLIMVEAPLFNMLSVMAFWLMAAHVISWVEVFKPGAFRGLAVSLILMIPMALAVAATNPKDFAPMISMALLLGPLVGWASARWGK